MLTYEEYFQLDPLKDGHVTQSIKNAGSSKGDTTYEQFIKQKESNNIFENELLDMEYKFWETEEDKQHRIKKLWIDLKRKNALGGSEARSTGEQIAINKQIVELVRKIRWRVD